MNYAVLCQTFLGIAFDKSYTDIRKWLIQCSFTEERFNLSVCAGKISFSDSWKVTARVVDKAMVTGLSFYTIVHRMQDVRDNNDVITNIVKSIVNRPVGKLV